MDENALSVSLLDLNRPFQTSQWLTGGRLGAPSGGRTPAPAPPVRLELAEGAATSSSLTHSPPFALPLSLFLTQR